MKSKLYNVCMALALFGISMFSINSFAQTQIGNSDFENWDELGTTKERPANWNNMMNGDLCQLCSFAQTQTSWQSSDTRPGSSGSYSAEVKTGSISGMGLSQIINGSITLGKLHAPSTTASDGFNQTHRADNQFSESITDSPDSLVVWVKYSITDNTDSARVSAVLHDDYDFQDPTDINSNHVVATVIKNFQTNGNWIRLSVPFDYSGPSTDAQYIIITFTSSFTPGAGVDGATLYVDDMELIYNDPVVSNSVAIAPTATQNLLENEVGTVIEVTETPSAASSREWKFSSTSGSGYASFSPIESGTAYTPQFSAAGTYYVVCVSDFSGDIKTSNEVTIIVTEDQTSGLTANEHSSIMVFADNGDLKIDLSNSNMNGASIQVVGLSGQLVANQSLLSNQINTIDLSTQKGIYIYTISDGTQVFKGKIFFN